MLYTSGWLTRNFNYQHAAEKNRPVEHACLPILVGTPPDNSASVCTSASNAVPLAHAPICRKKACGQIQRPVTTPPSPKRCQGYPVPVHRTVSGSASPLQPPTCGQTNLPLTTGRPCGSPAQIPHLSRTALGCADRSGQRTLLAPRRDSPRMSEAGAQLDYRKCHQHEGQDLCLYARSLGRVASLVHDAARMK